MVERRRLNRKRVMREFKIAELSAVDSPAQEGARAVIIKRDDTAADADNTDKCAMSYPQAAPLAQVQQDIEALDFDEVLAGQQSAEAAQRIRNCVWEKWDALQRSFDTIAADDSLDATTKVARMKQSLQQFLAAVREESEQIAEAITKSISAAPALAELLDITKGEHPMPDHDKKQFEELQKSVSELKAQLDASGQELEKLRAELAAAQALSKMSDEEKEFMAEMDEDERKEFMALTPEERRKRMKKAIDDNPVVYKSESTGEEFRKNDDPRLIKLAKQADENERLAKAERQKREDAELAKRADEPPYRAFAVEQKDGNSISKIDVLRAISKLDDGVRSEIERWLSIGAKAVEAAFDKIGHANTAHKSAADFSKRVSEIMQRDKISELEALRKARVEFPTEFEAFQASGAVVVPKAN